jgi:hypothetical protein
MQMEVIEDLLRRKLKITLRGNERAEIYNSFSHCRAENKQKLFEEAVIKTADMIAISGKKPSVAQVLDIFDHMSTNDETVSCGICKSSGWIWSLVIRGRHNGQEKEWIFNPAKPSQKFLKRMAMSGNKFIPVVRTLPCQCQHGDKRALRNGKEWITKKQRRMACERHIICEMAMADWINWIQAINAGEKWIPLKDKKITQEAQEELKNQIS